MARTAEVGIRAGVGKEGSPCLNRFYGRDGRLSPTLAETSTLHKDLMERKNRRVRKFLNGSYLPARMLSALMSANFLQG